RPPRSPLFPYHDALPILETPHRRWPPVAPSSSRRTTLTRGQGYWLLGRLQGQLPPPMCTLAYSPSCTAAAPTSASSWLPTRESPDRKSTRLNSSHVSISY